MKEQFNLALIQSDLRWENPEANYQILEEQLQCIEASIDLVVLCEMFTTGFSMSPEHIAEPMSDQMPTLTWMRKWASQLDACITGSVSVSEGGKYYNRLFWVFPDGQYQCYDKRHTFTFAGEDRFYQRGTQRLIVEWRGWRIMPLICYDLRFPIWSKNRIQNKKAAYDLLLYVANWPGVRRDPWITLLQARAIENQCYLAAVNRVGIDNNGLEYTGDSSVLNARGQTLANGAQKETAILTAQIDAHDLIDFREKFPVLFDDDDVVQ